MRKTSIMLAAVALIWSVGLARAGTPVGTSFTYQGQLKQNGNLYGGSADFIFRLYDAVTGGTQIGSDQTITGVAVDAGIFQVTLDFGAGAFGGDARWLEIWAKASSDQNYTQLTPRQSCSPSPYSIFASNAQGGGGPWQLNNGDLTYSGGSVGVLGASSPFASGKGLFLEGGNASFASLFAFDYDNYAPLNLSLNAPGGNVGIGTSAPNAKLRIQAGTSNVNPLWITSNNASFAALYVQNFANNSFGIYDDASAKHYLSGMLGVGTTSPVAMIHAAGVEAIRGEGTSGGLFGFVAAGVHGIGEGNPVSGYAVGVLAEGTHSNGLYATTQDAGYYGGYFKNLAGGAALFADGLAKVKTLQILGGADLAERFETDESAEPGTVMMIDANHPGRLQVCNRACCRGVAGVVSGAHALHAGVVLGEGEGGQGSSPIALSGRVWVKCDASAGSIHPGDLLTTSSRPGYAMKAPDGGSLPGAVLGKAMSSLDSASGMVLVLVTLQ